MKSNGIFLFYLCTISIVCLTVQNCLAKESGVVYLNEDNWHLLLENEWLVQFYAPWCPACKNLKPTWDELSSLARNYKVAKIDVTDSPALSGRFFVTTLPTIFHVINGEFRQYRGPRDLKSYQNFVEKKQWQSVETISSWIRPDSIQMNIVAGFFKLSHNLKELNNKMNQEYGMPMWVTYGIFAVATVLVGALLGLVFVCVADFIFPPKAAKRKSFSNEEINNADTIKGDEIESDDMDEPLLEKLKTSDNEEADNDDDDVDDDVQEDEEDEKHKSETEAEVLDAPNTPEVRKRKSRKD